MAGGTTYKSMEVYDGVPSGDGGKALDNNSVAIADRIGSYIENAGDPDASDDDADTNGNGVAYQNSLWLNTTDKTVWLCIDATATAAVWKHLNMVDIVLDTTPQLGGDLDVNGQALVSTSDGDIALTPNGTGSVLLSGSVVIGSDDQLLQFGVAQDYSIQWDGDDAVHTISAGQFRFVGGNIELEDTTDANAGVITKGADRFIHNFHHPTGGGAVPIGSNTFIGVNAGNFTMTAVAGTYQGSKNVGIGTNVLDALTTGYSNMGIGSNALGKCNAGHSNVAVGVDTLVELTTGSADIGIGNGSLLNCTGSKNVGIGNSALVYITSGEGNVGISYWAGKYIADGITPNQTTNNSVYLGRDTRASADGADNEVVIGYNAIGKGTNTMVLGGSILTHVYLANDNQKLGFGVGLTDLELYSDGTDGQIDATTNLDIHPAGVTTIGDGGATNYAQFAADGELTLAGTARVKKHLMVTPGQLTKVAGGNPPGISSQGTFAVLLYDPGGTEEAFYNMHMPEDWALGTNFMVKIYWAPTTNDVGKHVQWEIDWEACKQAVAAAGEILGAGSTNIELHDDTYAGAWNLQGTSEGTIAGGSLEATDVVGIKVSRVIEPADDYDAADAAFIHLEIEYTADKLGEAT